MLIHYQVMLRNNQKLTMIGRFNNLNHFRQFEENERMFYGRKYQKRPFKILYYI